MKTRHLQCGEEETECLRRRRYDEEGAEKTQSLNSSYLQTYQILLCTLVLYHSPSGHGARLSVSDDTYHTALARKGQRNI